MTEGPVERLTEPPPTLWSFRQRNTGEAYAALVQVRLDVVASLYAVRVLPGDSQQLRKQRGAFFTPDAIADFLTAWALQGHRGSTSILDPTCGEGAFLLAAARAASTNPQLSAVTLDLYGADTHTSSLQESREQLATAGYASPTLLRGDFFMEPTPDQLGARLPFVDAVVGNPPFVRYHEHRGETRRYAAAAALTQGVRLSGLASSWAALLVHAAAFLKPEGRIAIVLPAELLSVGYAEPIRRWLRRRFQSVHLVLFERLQFHDAEEQVVLLVAKGSGGCDAFSLHHVADSAELSRLHIFDAEAFAPRDEGKWTDLLLPHAARGVLKRVTTDSFVPLSSYGTSELGTVTGANNYFTLSESTRVKYKLVEGRHVTRTVPPGSRHIPGLQFTAGLWEQLKLDGQRVWMLNPTTTRQPTGALARYVELGETLEVDRGYKCSIRTPWWRPPVQEPPDFFFTYMNHVSPRIIRNTAGATFVNSMHGVVLHPTTSDTVAEALPYLAMNTVTRLSAEITGRTYGGGILKMEPSEAAQLSLPDMTVVGPAWVNLQSRRHELDELVRAGDLEQVTKVVDSELRAFMDLNDAEYDTLAKALARRRALRQGRTVDGN